jgi:hypothetical protein
LALGSSAGKEICRKFHTGVLSCLMEEKQRDEAKDEGKNTQEYNMNERAETAKRYIKYNILLGTEPTLKAKNT